ncbi:hypothetical protein [Propionicimonas sp.]|uniref:hypothetical protein n=1 Tax=Propionicimonas sp. TaxID=1955623 RepID=UPI0018020E17|nr:hypothetical protein [Propionicimonas sp.]MBU3975934.1 hypothetical protein [Actinomycetota bacterium]MBA3020750.1 hypothetical protein [Propionicimonas sp.]MBU3985124.1 hypothetical protein [Actinomycetota bacterium]MBU4008114.1 hypothetical protein [Actinomycetota bacterium]MBU4064672.1 hypothetical protein [Actinomycetota bacterium]
MAQQVRPDAVAARAWQSASSIVLAWPELTISWADWYDRPAHLIVQSSSGVTLHYAGGEGPVLTADGAEAQLRWADVEYFDLSNQLGLDWADHWGHPTVPVQPTAKSAIYTAIAALVGPDDAWTARPAKILFRTEDPLDDPLAVFRLLSAFPSLMTTVQWYASQLSLGLRRASAGRELAWHEPLWQVSRNGQAVAVLDEAGRVHLARVSTNDDNLADLLELVADDADWVAGGFSFDILAALDGLDGDVDALVALIVPGARHAFGPRRSWSPAAPGQEPVNPRRLEP